MTVAKPQLSHVIIAGFFVLFAAIGSYAFNAIDIRMQQAEARIVALENASNQKRERITALEAKQGDEDRRFDEIQKGIDLLIRMHLKEGK